VYRERRNLMPPIRNSAHWMPDIERLCDAFYSARLTGEAVIYRKNSFADIDDYCNVTVDEVKNEVYRDRTLVSDCLLDRHKIAAIHIVAVLKKQPFLTGAALRGATFMDMLPNEHYALLLLGAILGGWHRSNGDKAELKIPKTFKDNLILLFNKYKKTQSAPIIDNIFVYALANIVYLVEERFLNK
jgi:hypothetical protein